MTLHGNAALTSAREISPSTCMVLHYRPEVDDSIYVITERQTSGRGLSAISENRASQTIPCLA